VTAGPLELAVELWRREDAALLEAQLAVARLCLCIGDHAESVSRQTDGLLANAVVFDVDLRSGVTDVLTSIVGLPPVFSATTDRCAVISSPCHPDVPRTPDFEAVADVLRYGHPLFGRTLNAAVRLLPAGATLRLDESGRLIVTASSGVPGAEAAEFSHDDRIEAQIQALDKAAQRLPADSAVVSLSGGLDSRVALMSQLAQGRRPLCATMAASPANLDARLASAFCRAYGLEHLIVDLGEDFQRSLPDLVLTASRLSGGVSCLSQAIDVHFHRSLPTGARCRITGNLGNQVGRGGVESISVGHPDARVLGSVLAETLKSRSLDPWYIARMIGSGYGNVLFREEVAFWSVANYQVGSSFMPQLSPYADVNQVQLATRWLNASAEFENPTADFLRKRDIRHRTQGTPLAGSFQRRYLVRNDQRASRVPVNWGWLAEGGWSPRWVMAAGMTAADAALIKFGNKIPSLRRSALWLSSRLGRPSALVSWPAAFKGPLRDLVRDTFASRRLRESGLVEPSAFAGMVDDHFAGRRDAFGSLARLFEVAQSLR
jgi:hypothetical protein